MAKRRNTDCDCIFCNSECPECGSTAITVRYRPGIQYDNCTGDVIRFERNEDWIEVTCIGCGGEFESDQWNKDPRLDRLLSALGRTLLADVIKCEHKEGGTIDVSHYEVKSVIVKPKGGDR